MTPVPREIIFTPTRLVVDKYLPQPAKNLLPDWYKATGSYINNRREVVSGNMSQTIKKCVPVFDALTAGYVIPLWTDIYVRTHDGQTEFNLDTNHHDIVMHSLDQAPIHPRSQGTPYPKFINPWSIRTPKGYSCLFVPPLHNPNPYFTILEGVVDTDIYTAPVNLPFVLNETEFSGLIPAGTPLVQVIPFKRDEWKMRLGGADDHAQANAVGAMIKTKWFDSYKSQFWYRKSFN